MLGRDDGRPRYLEGCYVGHDGGIHLLWLTFSLCLIWRYTKEKKVVKQQVYIAKIRISVQHKEQFLNIFNQGSDLAMSKQQMFYTDNIILVIVWWHKTHDLVLIFTGSLSVH